MAYVRRNMIKTLILNIFIVISYASRGVQTLSQNNETSDNYDKVEFRRWFKEIQDFEHDNCQINAVSSNNNENNKMTSHINKQKLINVVKCSTGKGRWNYRLKVIRNAIHCINNFITN